jgi:hypothetical protein
MTWRSTLTDPPPEGLLVVVTDYPGNDGFAPRCDVARRIKSAWHNDDWHRDMPLSRFPLWFDPRELKCPT